MPNPNPSPGALTEAFFLSAGQGQRFALYHPPHPGVAPRGAVLYVHPFAEEMNKARRMAAAQARALAAEGFGVLQLDLQGCGDSSGDFGDASWDDWVDDVIRGADWLRARWGDAPLWLWGLRAGCLLCTAAAPRLAPVPHFLFWAPAPAGKPLLQQFLRLKAAADLAGGNAKAILEDLRAQLARGEPVEIAGYTLSAALCSGLEQAVLHPVAGAQRLAWFELSTREDATLPPAAVRVQEGWQQAGVAVQAHLVTGPSFWQTTEIEDAPALITATTRALTGVALSP